MEERRATLPPPPPPPPPSRRRWSDVPISRDPSNGRLGGVIAGVSRAYGFDTRMSRLVFAVACWPVPVLILVYLGAWILLPSSPAQAASLHQLLFDRHRVSAFTRGVLVVLVIVLLTSGALFAVFSPFHTHGLSWAFALLVIGLLLWVVPERSHDALSLLPPPPPSGLSSQWSTPSSPSMPSSTSTQSFTSAPSDETGPARPVAPPVPFRPRHPVGSIIVAATAVGVAFAAAGDAFGWWKLSIFGTALTVTLVLVGAAVTSIIVNRRVGPLFAVLPLSLIATFLLIVHPNLTGATGNRTVSAATVADAERPQRQAAGQLSIDLTAVTAVERPVTVDAKLGMGRLHVLVPADAVLAMDASVGAGHIVIDGRETTAGLRVSDHDTDRPRGTSGMTFVIHIRVGAGELAIDRDGGSAGR